MVVLNEIWILKVQGAFRGCNPSLKQKVHRNHNNNLFYEDSERCGYNSLAVMKEFDY